MFTLDSGSIGSVDRTIFISRINGSAFLSVSGEVEIIDTRLTDGQRLVNFTILNFLERESLTSLISSQEIVGFASLTFVKSFEFKTILNNHSLTDICVENEIVGIQVNSLGKTL